MQQIIAHVVGARPTFIKAAPVMRALAATGAEQRLIHTGQHYDDAMSAVFFRHLGLPHADLNLGVGSGTRARNTPALLVALADGFGNQEERTMIGVPCLTVGPNTERPITITQDTNRLVRPEEVGGGIDEILAGRVVTPTEPPPLWDGWAGERIPTIVRDWLDDRHAIAPAVP
jgi:UDP-N-acetylglucosamine 2-epimerase